MKALVIFNPGAGKHNPLHYAQEALSSGYEQGIVTGATAPLSNSYR
jgi:hypothetical protein